MLGWADRPSATHYVRLKESLSRMQATSVEIYSRRLARGVSVSLIRRFEYESGPNGVWQIHLEPEMRELFGDVHYTLVEWETRLHLGPLAKWLYSFYASHRNPYPMRVDTLQRGSGSNTRRLRQFRWRLRHALNELVESSLLESFEIDDDDLVHVRRA